MEGEAKTNWQCLKDMDKIEIQKKNTLKQAMYFAFTKGNRQRERPTPRLTGCLYGTFSVSSTLFSLPSSTKQKTAICVLLSPFCFSV